MRLWIAFALGAVLLEGFVYTHTDELTVIFTLLIVLGFALGFAFARYWLFTWLLLGLVCPVSEVLIGYKLLSAPFEGGHPLNACVGFVPALLGTALGRFSRKLNPARLQ